MNFFVEKYYDLTTGNIYVYIEILKNSCWMIYGEVTERLAL